MSFSEKLRSLREAYKLSQTQLAKKVGVSQSSIGYWERGEKVPSADSVYKIANFFKVDISELLQPDEPDTCSTTLLCDNIKRLRKQKGLSIGELSKLTGIPEITLSHYESGLMTPKGNNIVRLGSVLDPSGHELLSDDELPFYLYVPGTDLDGQSLDYLHAEEGSPIKQNEVEIISAFRELNDLGRSEATKRVKELTEIVRYLNVKE